MCTPRELSAQAAPVPASLPAHLYCEVAPEYLRSPVHQPRRLVQKHLARRHLERVLPPLVVLDHERPALAHSLLQDPLTQ